MLAVRLLLRYRMRGEEGARGVPLPFELERYLIIRPHLLPCYNAAVVGLVTLRSLHVNDDPLRKIVAQANHRKEDVKVRTAKQRCIPISLAILVLCLFLGCGKKNASDVEKLLAKVPAARLFKFYDLDAMEQVWRTSSKDFVASKDAEPPELPYGALYQILDLPRDTEAQLRQIIPDGHRGVMAESRTFEQFDSEDFFTLYQPESYDMSKLESLLTKHGFKRQVRDSVSVWSGQNNHRGSVMLILSKRCIYITNSLTTKNGTIYLGEYTKSQMKGRLVGDMIVLEKPFTSQPRVKEFMAMIVPNTFVFNIETPSMNDSIFGQTHQTDGMARTGDVLYAHNSCFYENQDAANQAYQFHTEKRKQHPVPLDESIGKYAEKSEEMRSQDNAIVWESTYKRR